VHPDAELQPMGSAAFITCEQLSGYSGMSMMELDELVGYSALIPQKGLDEHPDSKNNDDWVFSVQWVKPLRAACKLRNDFDLDLFTVAIVLGTLSRIDDLEHSLRSIEPKVLRLTCPDAGL
jgi:chaperone modulatory protein CbpM